MQIQNAVTKSSFYSSLLLVIKKYSHDRVTLKIRSKNYFICLLVDLSAPESLS